MAINISRLWRDASFHSLGVESKLLYIYLSTSPNINSLGLLCISVDVAMMELGVGEEVFRSSCSELVRGGYIRIYNHNGTLWFMVVGHFDTLPKSIAVSNKANKEILKVPEIVLDKMVVDGVLPEIEQHSEFNPPTPEEVTEYAMKEGYLLDGKKVVDYYTNQAELFNKKKGWYDSRGKEVRNWKNKVKRVWLRNLEKMKAGKDAPEGYEYFCVNTEDGIVQAISWRNGKPYAGNIVDDKLLQSKYEGLIKNRG